MAKDRIGKLERWILIHALLKKEGKLPEDWIYPYKRYKFCNDFLRLCKKCLSIEKESLSNYEILKNYFKAENLGNYFFSRCGRGNRFNPEADHFEYAKMLGALQIAYSSTSRTRKKLCEKGLIIINKVICFSSSRDYIENIKLTESGEEKARFLTSRVARDVRTDNNRTREKKSNVLNVKGPR